MFKIKRIYDEYSSDDGIRILVDRLWPRGISKEKAKLDHWFKNVAPSTELRKWFHHEPDKFQEFILKYRHELDENNPVELQELIKLGKDHVVTLLYSAKDEEHNQANVLIDYLQDRF
ncbi:hypothetical protein AN964_23615 [Heyndrickxia shackletonii]|uniref:DUF488 domain-containing protein n=1 Tax=Heyndrickxia shackletonii TaxID=157838 RepID=A0A0Q3WQR4_9BACI|nr:DUF488 domain-containing protein [Heyndrickxia shackletonii]KQL50636.1 hypothetical protein AN964_23615 [Heyndrickxia shackletonii]MBB2479961.1 DUF488 domain-containing protein [Bacillus sp. APMAM]NEY98048.1 DUF488 domain-containing protein [Heyndrickxia shackletonii]RTZ56647.1 DUF488 domain-containing protein [Bacillus sp. SAJ1]